MPGHKNTALAGSIYSYCKKSGLHGTLEGLEKREIHTTSMYISFDDDVHTSNAVKRDLYVLVVPPVAHLRHVRAVRLVFLVPLGENDVFVEGVGELAAGVGFLPGVVVEAAFDVDHFAVIFFVAVEPDVYS